MQGRRTARLITWTLAFLLLAGVVPAYAQDGRPQPTDTPTVTVTGTPPTPVPTDTPIPTPTLAESLTPTPTASATETPLPTMTPRPEVAEFIFDWQEEVIYPEGIWFKLVVDRPLDEIATISLTLAVSGEATPRVIDFGTILESVEVSDPFTDIELLWRVPQNNPIPLLSRVDYNWTVILQSEESEDVPGVTAYIPPGQDDLAWTLSPGPTNAINFIIPVAIGATTDVVRTNLRFTYERLSDQIGTRPTFNYALTSPEFSLDPCAAQEVVVGVRSGVEVDCRDGLVDAVLRDMGFASVELPSLDAFTIQGRLVQDIVSGFYANAWQGSDVPAWFRVGFAYFYTPEDKRGLLLQTQSAIRSGTLLTLNQMVERDTLDTLTWDSQAYTMVLYIADQAGVDGLERLAQGEPPLEGQPVRSFAERYAQITGQELGGLLPTLENWALSEVAERGASLDLYRGPTLVPTPTASNTPFPPSPTPTFTHTPTATPTPTVTGFLTATPLPTLTPIPTATPGDPTITPLPADFVFPTAPPPTPAPVSASTSDDGSTDQTLGIFLLGAAVVLGAAIAVIYRRARERARYGL